MLINSLRPVATFELSNVARPIAKDQGSVIPQISYTNKLKPFLKLNSTRLYRNGKINKRDRLNAWPSKGINIRKPANQGKLTSLMSSLDIIISFRLIAT